MNNEFLTSLNDWGSIITGTYERATKGCMLYTRINKCPRVKDKNGKSFVPTHLYVSFKPQQKEDSVWMQNYITSVQLLMLVKCNVKSYTLFNDKSSITLPGDDSVFEIQFTYASSHNTLSIRDLYLVNSHSLHLINMDTDNNDITFNDVTFNLFKELIDKELSNIKPNDMGLSAVNKSLKVLNDMIADPDQPQH